MREEAEIVLGIMVVLEFPPPEKRPTYAGLANTAVGIVSAFAPLFGAGLAAIGYAWLFVASAVGGLLAFGLMRWWVREPRFVNG